MVIGSGAILRNAVGLRDVDAGTVRTSSQCGTAGRSDGWCALLGGLLFPSPLKPSQCARLGCLTAWRHFLAGKNGLGMGFFMGFLENIEPAICFASKMLTPLSRIT